MNKLTVEIARKFAEEKHKGQKRRGGEPYFTHPERIARKCKTEEQKIVAYLHDTLEDCGVTESHLHTLGATKEIVGALQALTRGIGEDRYEYLLRVFVNPLARYVKILDLCDNMNDEHCKKEKKYTYFLELKLLGAC